MQSNMSLNITPKRVHLIGLGAIVKEETKIIANGGYMLLQQTIVP
jgi:hypothetical protein